MIIFPIYRIFFLLAEQFSFQIFQGTKHASFEDLVATRFTVLLICQISATNVCDSALRVERAES